MMRTVCVITGSRADYGHLVPVMQAIAADPALELQVIACGQHLDPRFGNTWEAIVADGFTLAAKVPPGLTDDSREAVAEATARTVSGVAQALAKLRPDVVMILGDRYEILAAATAALILNIPIAHIHGGEITEAAMDDAIRHAISKMAALHFVASEPYAARLRQMGEPAERIVVSGAPGLDHLATMTFLTREGLEARLGLPLSKPVFLVTYHPVTLQADAGAGAARALLDALAAFPAATLVFTGVNSDPGHDRIATAIGAFVAADPARRRMAASLGQLAYLSLMRMADAVVGNSSSGLIEAPALGVPTVNIGDRQRGRLRSASVIDCGEKTEDIIAALRAALDPGFRQRIAGAPAAYAHGGAAAKIVAALKHAPADLSVKQFQDIKPG
jgi:UDP-hydrolysing UDP-N-acetyl-D-glucosamine 2-epimerase